MAAAHWLSQLNPSQYEAVTYGDGPLLVVAGAGTGKTKTLACRVAHLVERGVRPDRILLLTFTRRAAAEMLDRAAKLTTQSTLTKVWGGTFHAVANRLLRLYARAVGLTEGFTVIDEEDAADILNLIRTELGFGKKDRRFPRKATLAKIYSHTVNAEKPLSEVVERHFPWCRGDLEALGEIFGRYARRKRASNVVDYDDLLLLWRLLCTQPGVGERVGERFDHVLVDEYQDTNAIQAQILVGMRQRCKNIMAVGDDAQSIYSFRAATIRNILDFPERFLGTHVVTLEENYRSTQPILAASNTVMSYARERYTKELRSQRPSEQKPVLLTCVDEAQQSRLVCHHVLEHRERGLQLMQQAVLFRAGHHSAQLEVELASRNIPFRKYGGLRFVEAAHIKDLVAFLRVLENPHDELSWFRVLQLLEGIGPAAARRIIRQLGVHRMQPEGEGEAADEVAGEASPLQRLLRDPPKVPPAAAAGFAALRQALGDCAGLGRSEDTAAARGTGMSVAAQLERIRQFYQPVFERLYENAPARLRDIEQLQAMAVRYRSRQRFITDLTLDPPNSTADLAAAPYLDEDYLILSTIHSAKGMEWNVVHIIHAADGMIPSDMATGSDEQIEEERRLFYVAMTRAKDMLYVYFPLRYYHHRFGLSDAHTYAQLTRFLPADARACFEPRFEKSDADADQGELTARVSVDEFLDQLWKR
ncbi:MAG TPA: ATP-dependent helicase [Phycisphaerae bacterium]|nr:ATP-dependent helicase [Phycisphaerae bacterium]HNU44527.1 ATP-dependent helicase [Phycisphaerae bacterium]